MNINFVTGVVIAVILFVCIVGMVELLSEARVRYCPTCGVVIHKGDNTCRVCGTTLKE